MGGSVVYPRIMQRPIRCANGYLMSNLLAPWLVVRGGGEKLDIRGLASGCGLGHE